MNCINCGNILTGRQTKFCCPKCKGSYRAKSFMTYKEGLDYIISNIKIGDEKFDKCLTDNNIVGLSNIKWYNSEYIHSSPEYGSVSLHVIIWTFFNGAIPKGYQVDHINRDKTDNRLCNLRLATHGQNSANVPVKKNKKNSKYKGVQRTASGKYQACIWFNKKNHALGSFETEEEAALKYNEKAKELQGDFAYQNVILQN